MNKIRVLTRAGTFQTMEWDYDPAVNTAWAQKARDILAGEQIAGEVWEVAPEVFWYSTAEDRFNCHKWA